MQTVVIILTIVFILGGEGVLWYLFSSKIRDMSFPRAMDTSFFGFFTVARIRIFAAIHALVMCVIAVLSLWLLW